MKRMSRRGVLRGLGGAMVALPALDIFEGRASAADKPTYAVFVVTCNGVVQDLGEEPELFWPSKTGTLRHEILEAEASTRASAMLARHAERLLLVRGLNHAFPTVKACSHTWGDNQTLTAQPGSEDKDGPATSLALGESIDNRIAREKNPNGRGPLTLHAGNQRAGGKGYGSPGYVSYKGPSQPNSPDSSPWEAYTRIAGLTSSDPQLAKLVATRRKSVNDFVRVQLKRLQARPDLSAEDRRRLDAHFSAVRDLELGMTAALPPETLKEMEGLNGKDAASRVMVHLNENRDAVARLHLDLIAFAFAGDVTRTATLKIGDNNDAYQAMLDGVRQPSYHMISHRILSDGSSGAPIENAVQLHGRVVRVLMQHFCYITDKLAAASSPDGSLLDRGFAVWTNQIANGAHEGRNLPYVVVGKANGRLKCGQFIDAGGIPHSHMLNTLLAAADVKQADGSPVTDFGHKSLKPGTMPDVLAGV